MVSIIKFIVNIIENKDRAIEIIEMKNLILV